MEEEEEILPAAATPAGADDNSILCNKRKTTGLLTTFLSIRTSKLKEKGMIGTLFALLRFLCVLMLVAGDDIADYAAPGSSATNASTIYGTPLATVLQKHGGPIPPILKQCKEALESCKISLSSLFPSDDE